MNPSERVLQLGDPRLRVVSRAVTRDDADFLRQAADLIEVLTAFQAEHGFGRAIAAPQIGIAKRFVAVDLGRTRLGSGKAVLVNPRIVQRSAATFELWDDCMSFPELYVRVRRHRSIRVEARRADGSRVRWFDLHPAVSELLQHEIDHLDGILAVDRAADPQALVTRAAFHRNRGYFQGLLETRESSPT